MKKFLLPLALLIAVVAVLLVIRWSTGKRSTSPSNQQATDTSATTETTDVSVATEDKTGGKIVVAVPNWPSANAKANIIKVVIEDNFGVEVELQSGSNAVIYEAINNGTMHVHPEGWIPHHANLLKKFVEEQKTIVRGDKTDEGGQGVCTTKGTVERTGIAQVTDLVNPQIAQQFDTDGDGKGEMWGGASGWGSTIREQIRAKSYGYDKTMDLKIMEEGVAMAELDVAVTKGQNIVFSCYAPHHSFAMYDLVLLKEEPHDESKWHIVEPSEDPDWLEKSTATTAWKQPYMSVYYAKSLQDSHPLIAKMLSQFTISSDKTSTMTYEIQKQEGKITIAVFAKQWVSNNSSSVDSWLQ